jgi:hypothetical protein
MIVNRNTDREPGSYFCVLESCIPTNCLQIDRKMYNGVIDLILALIVILMKNKTPTQLNGLRMQA